MRPGTTAQGSFPSPYEGQAQRAAAGGRPAWARRAQWWRRWALSLGSQLGLVGLACAVYVLSKSRAPAGARRPINSWQWGG